MAPLVTICVIVASLTVFATTRGDAAKALYVFGDSYADTGNHDPLSKVFSIYKPWRAPYGMTWPGTPSGRYSDGHVFTDFFALHMGLQRCLPFRLLNISTINEEKKEALKKMTKSRGINFAFGGSGVFETYPFVPNITTQIQQLSTVLDLGMVTINQISDSIALFTLNGNDYAAYYDAHQTFEGIETLIPRVVKQMAYDLENLSNLGFKNLVVSNLGPLGCVPYLTYVNNYTACLDIVNILCDLHNKLLSSQISNLKEKLPNSTFLILDLNNAINEIIKEGALSLKPCCEVISEGSCGQVNTSGNPLYRVCSNVDASLYWDTFHPTNNGWSKILNILLPSLQNTYHLPLHYAKI